MSEARQRGSEYVSLRRLGMSRFRHPPWLCQASSGAVAPPAPICSHRLPRLPAPAGDTRCISWRQLAEAIHAVMAWEGGNGSQHGGPSRGDPWQMDRQRRQRRDLKRDEQRAASHAPARRAEWSCGRCGKRNYMYKWNCRECDKEFAEETDVVHGWHPAVQVGGPALQAGIPAGSAGLSPEVLAAQLLGMPSTEADGSSGTLAAVPDLTACPPGAAAAGPTRPEVAAEDQSGGPQKRWGPRPPSRPLPGLANPGLPHGQLSEANGDLQEAVPRAAEGASGGAAASGLDVIPAQEHTRAMEYTLKFLVEGFRQAQKRAEDARTGLSLAQDALEQAQDDHRVARKEAATAETALSEAAEEVAVRLATEEASKAAELVPIMRDMVHAIRKRNMKEVLAVSRRAEALLTEQELGIARGGEQ